MTPELINHVRLRLQQANQVNARDVKCHALGAEQGRKNGIRFAEQECSEEEFVLVSTSRALPGGYDSATAFLIECTETGYRLYPPKPDMVMAQSPAYHKGFTEAFVQAVSEVWLAVKEHQTAAV